MKASGKIMKFLRTPKRQKLGLISQPSPELSSLLSTRLRAKHTARPRLHWDYTSSSTHGRQHVLLSPAANHRSICFTIKVWERQSCSWRAWQAGVTSKASLTWTQQPAGAGHQTPLSRTGHSCWPEATPWGTRRSHPEGTWTR